MARRKYVKENNLVKAINTDGLELQKPLVNEYYDINVHNSNMDKIDLGYKQNKNDISNINYELSKSENTKYTTENGIKEFSCKDGYVDNVTIEGETLVNLSDIGFINEDIGDNITRTQFSNKNRCTNNHYTLINLTDKTIFFTIQTIANQTYTRGVWVEPKTHHLEFISENESIYGVDFDLRNGWEQGDHSIFKPSMFMILEGDHTNRPISYFEGLKSVGQGDSIEVLTHNEVSNSVTILESMCAVGKYVGANGELESVDNEWCATDFIEIKDNYIDFGSYNNPIDYWSTCFYDENKKFISNLRGGIGSGFDNVKPKDAKFLRTSIKTGFSSTDIRFCNKIDKKQISTTLRSLPNGVKDTIEKRGNKYYKIKRCGEVILNGGENWSLINTRTNTITFGFSKLSDMKYVNDDKHIISDKFISYSDANNTVDVEKFWNNQWNLFISISKTKLSAQTVEGFKTWLQSNPVTIVYELATPIITELPNFNPQTYEGDTTLLINSGVIQAEAEFEVTNSIGSEIDVLKSKVSSLDDYVDNCDYTLTPLNGWKFDNATITREDNHVQINMILAVQGITTVGTKIATFPYNLKPRTVVICNLIDVSGAVIGAIEIVNNFIQVNGAFNLNATHHGCMASFSYYI